MSGSAKAVASRTLAGIKIVPTADFGLLKDVWRVG
jgi:hypothetical protein